MFYSELDFVGFGKKKYMRFLQSTGLLPMSHQARHTWNKNLLNIFIFHKSWTWTQAFNSSMDRRPKILTAISLGSEAKSVPLSMLVHLRLGHLRFLVLNWSDIGVIGGTFFGARTISHNTHLFLLFQSWNWSTELRCPVPDIWKIVDWIHLGSRRHFLGMTLLDRISDQ